MGLTYTWAQLIHGLNLYMGKYGIKLIHLFPLQIQSGNGDVTITNDGATILKQMQVLHPAARMV